MRWKPNATVATVIEQNGKYLLVEEIAENQLVYNQPAGHLEENETYAEAAVREVLEETGWDVQLDAVQGLYTYFAEINQTTYHRMCFTGTALQHHPEYKLDEGIQRAVWLSLDELKASGKARSPLVIKCIEDHIAGKRFPLDFIYEHPHTRNTHEK